MPEADAAEPAAHAAQLGEPEAAAVPGAHVTQAPKEEGAVPLRQGEQAEAEREPGELTLPAGQGVQAAEEAEAEEEDHVLAGQRVQAAAPRGAQKPGPQGRQASGEEDPSKGEKNPAGQSVHDGMPRAAAKDPGGHLWQLKGVLNTYKGLKDPAAQRAQ